MIGLFDADIVPYIVCFNKKDEPIKFLDDCINHADDYLTNVAKKLDLKEFHLFFTLGRGFRYTIYPEYKANRKNNIKPEYFKEVRDYLIEEYDGIYLKDELEADDLLRIYENKYTNEGILSTIISGDKDLLMLNGINYDLNKGVNGVTNSFNAQLFFLKSLIVGDSADGIKGLPKKGEKFFEKLEKDNTDDFGIVDLKLLREDIIYEYLEHFGEEIGVEEFYKNYKCLKILSSHKDVKFQEPVDIQKLYAKTPNLVR